MAKRIRSREQELNTCLKAELLKGMTINGEDVQLLAKLIGVSTATMYTRLKNPSTFKLGEVRMLIKHFDLDAPTVCTLMGVQ